jgi:hypothetical protein
VPGNLPWPVPIHMRSQLRRHSKTTGSLPKRSVPLGSADGWGGSSRRFLRDSRVAVWRGSGGRWDGQKPSPLLTGTASR